MATMAMMVGVLMAMMAMMKTMTVKLSGVSMSRLLTDADTEAMVQRVQPEERDEVELFSFLLFIRFRLYHLFLFVLVVSLLPTTGQCFTGEAQGAAEEEICKLIPTRGSHSGDWEIWHTAVHWS